MKKSILTFAALMFTISFFYSCQKDNVVSTEDIENFTNESIQNIEATTRTGRGGCFELVFPVSLAFPSNKTIEVNNYEELKNAIKAWIKENGKPGKALATPHFVFPIDVITKDGETVTVESLLELIALKKECISLSDGQGLPCFKLNYPISILYPDNSTATFNTPKEMRIALREWKKNNANSIYRPVLSYPISITMADGTVVAINSKEELRRIKENCK